MSCSYWGTSYNDAFYNRAICEYERIVSQLNVISNNYESKLSEAKVFFEDSSKMQDEAVLILKSMPSQKLMSTVTSLNASKIADNGILKMEEAATLIDDGTYHSFSHVLVAGIPIQTGCYLYNSGGFCVAPIFTIYYQLVAGNNVQMTYKQAIDHVNSLASEISDYFSYSFSVSFGSGGSFQIGADTWITLVNLALDVARDINLISDKDYANIKSSKWFGLVLSIASSIVEAYGVKAFGLKKTPLGYIDNRTAQEMFTPEVKEVFKTLDILKTAYYLGLAISMEFDNVDKQKDKNEISDSIEEVKKQQRILRSEHKNNNRFMPLDNMIKVAETKYDRIGNFRVFNSV